MGRFDMILKHLSRKRDKVKITEQTNRLLQFYVTNGMFEKMFEVRYFDDDAEKEPIGRPFYHYYWMYFYQKNYIQNGRFVDIVDSNWYVDEDDVLDTIKLFCKKWRA